MLRTGWGGNQCYPMRASGVRNEGRLRSLYFLIGPGLIPGNRVEHIPECHPTRGVAAGWMALGTRE